MRDSLNKTPAQTVQPIVTEQTDEEPHVIDRLDPKDEREKANFRKF